MSVAAPVSSMKTRRSGFNSPWLARHSSRAWAIAQLGAGGFVFGSERLTGALLDRLTHHVHILQMNGDSYRLNHSKSRSRRASSETPVDNPTQA